MQLIIFCHYKQYQKVVFFLNFSSHLFLIMSVKNKNNQKPYDNWR